MSSVILRLWVMFRPESNSGPPAWQPDTQQTEPQVLEWGEIFCFPKGDPVSNLNDLLPKYSELFIERYEGP